MPFVNVNRCDIYYEMVGRGPAVVFVHGESHGLEMFKHAVAHFADRYTCLSYYRRGHGKSGLPPYGYSLWNQYVDLAALLDALKIDAAILLGVAMSTPLVVTYALNHPQRVRGLVLASWYELSGYPLLEAHRKTKGVFMGDIRMRMEGILRKDGRAALEAWMEDHWEAMFPIFSENAAARGEAIRMFASHPVDHYVKSAEYYTSLPNLIPQMTLIQCPVLGVCGADDPSPDHPELLQGMRDFRQVWIEGARRFTMMEKPAAFNAHIERFLTDQMAV
jgi:3-oxoadipate enol-lactonase